MSTTPDLTGRTIDKYQISAFIASGGMAAVYRAHQTNLSREVAIKVLPTAMAEDPMYVKRFLQEAETAAALEHPHIIPVHDYGSEKGLNFVVMRLLTGGTLTERMKSRQDSKTPLPSLGETARLLRQVGGALDYAHGRGVIHRDVKPSNIMFDHNGNPFLVDFGIAKLMATSAESLTETGVPMGTPIYMSPEQWDALPATPAIDQYSLAVVIYRLVTGDAPFRADTPYGLMQKHLQSPLPPITGYTDNINEKLHAVLTKAMGKKAADRYPNCIAFADAFEEAVSSSRAKPTNFFTYKLPDREWVTATIEEQLTAPQASEARIAAAPEPPKRQIGGVLIGLVLLAIIGVGAILLLTSGGDDNGDADETPIAEVAETEAATEVATEPATEPAIAGDPATEAVEAPTDDPTEATPTEAAVTNATLAPVSFTGDGVVLTLTYPESTLVIINRGDVPVDISGLRLQLTGGEQYYDQFGATTASNFTPGRCFVVGITADDPSIPDYCADNTPNPARLNFGTSPNIYFVWDSEVTVVPTFEVLLGNELLGTCEVGAGTCEIVLPTSRVITPTPTPRPVIGPAADESDGILLIYPNGTSITIINTSGLTFDLSGVQLELADASDHFDMANVGETTRTQFTPGRCIFLWLRSAGENPPDFCTAESPFGFDRTSQTSFIFVWDEDVNPTDTFTVSRDDEVFATCSVSDRRCFIPREDLVAIGAIAE